MTKPIQILPTRLAHSIMIVTGGFAVVLGLLVLLGWHTHNVHLLQMIPTFAPMQYNAALGLLLCGRGGAGAPALRQCGARAAGRPGSPGWTMWRVGDAPGGADLQ